MQRDSSGTQAATAIGRAVLSLAIAASVLIAASLAYTVMTSSSGGNAFSKLLPLNQFKTIMGDSRATDDGLEIIEFRSQKDSHHALVSLKTGFLADSYPLLSYHVNNWLPGQRINVIWRSANNPRKLSTAVLNRTLAKTGTINLARFPAWQGRVTEIGLHIVSDRAADQLSTPVQLEHLVLEPMSWRGMVAAVWSEWTGFQGWSGKSINYLSTVPTAPGTATLSPVLCAALLAATACLMLLIAGRRIPISRLSYAAALLLPWLLLDLLWNRQLSIQVAESRDRFAGKNMHEKHLADRDSQYYRYATRLKEQKLPKPSSVRIFVLRDSSGHDLQRLKIQYYLLPHNIYNFGDRPPRRGVRAGDYILALGKLPSLTYLESESKLTWPKQGQLNVSLEDRDELGALYRVQSSTPKGVADG